MKISIERLTAAREAIVREREDGRKFMPLILKLEHETAALNHLGADYRRIMGVGA